jgi:ribokinase
VATGGLPAAGTSRPLVVCVGDLMLDVSVTGAALAAGGDVPGSISLRPGGAAANVAVWARSVGAAARLVARHGSDLAGGLLRAELKTRGVELHPPEPADGSTGAALVVWTGEERSFVTDPGVNVTLRERHVRRGVGGADALYLSGYPLTRPGSRPAVLAVAREVASRTPSVVDAASWPLLKGDAAEAVLEAARLTGALLAAADEARALTGLGSPEDAATSLAEQAGVAVVKLGARGVLVAAGGGVHAIPAVQVEEAVDATGAGDAFAAGFLTARVEGADPVEAARAGAGCAARAVTCKGAWPPA